MFISHKSNAVQHVQDSEWQCRRKSKGISKTEYWAWIETITPEATEENPNPQPDYPLEDFTIVECEDEYIGRRLAQLKDYVNGETFCIKW